MTAWNRGFAQAGRTSRLLLLIPVALIVLITVADIVAPSDIVLGPLLVIAPAITAWGAGPLVTGGVGAAAVAAQAFIGWRSGLLLSRNVLVQLFALAVLSALIVILSVVRDRHTRELARVRSVAEAAQRVLLWPLPSRIGTLRLACVYLAAEEEAEIGGDLYAAARSPQGTRVVIGDVRGKGLPAIGEAAFLLGAFREAVHQNAGLPALAGSLERSLSRYLDDFEPTDEAGERFVTALLLEIPDDEPVVRMVSCGHLAPLLLQRGHAVSAPDLVPAPPLGVGLTDPGEVAVAVLPFAVDDTLLLFTDGVVEARDRAGVFYPLAERVAQWAGHPPEALLQRVQGDLLAHAGGRFGDDAALIAIRRSGERAPLARARQASPPG
ncbi:MULTISPECIES: PP2C family protein-serine/threonine phosphatase [unclassified Streptomyces]|uniref:PP2C family protein-serine/threonine phosphatase n=1 Tax=unclassified Streptomyces TaxID=2593676 RepID=UPI0011CE7BEA|nr:MULTISPECIES: PP2C family protein-serine/threonine phosphatase [unclassified Streptomyces]TXS74258.1 serine/threonine-protein phosphatase [Streptomyces sp. me109]